MFLLSIVAGGMVGFFGMNLLMGSRSPWDFMGLTIGIVLSIVVFKD